MKKLVSLLLILALCCLLVPALGEAGAESAADDEEIIAKLPEPGWVLDSVYGAVWLDDRASLEVFLEDVDNYKVLISWGSSAWEATEWEYSCYYHEDDNTMVSMPTGLRVELVFDDAGEQTSCTYVYEDGEAVFSLDGDGCLIWQDQKENAGEGMRFVRTGDTPAVPDEADAG